MNAPKCTEYDYINFLVAAQQVFSAVEAARSHPEGKASLRMTPTRACCNACRRIVKHCGRCIEMDKGLLTFRQAS
jgi:hypothetical protein